MLRPATAAAWRRAFRPPCFNTMTSNSVHRRASSVSSNPMNPHHSSFEVDRHGQHRQQGRLLPEKCLKQERRISKHLFDRSPIGLAGFQSKAPLGWQPGPGDPLIEGDFGCTGPHPGYTPRHRDRYRNRAQGRRNCERCTPGWLACQQAGVPAPDSGSHASCPGVCRTWQEHFGELRQCTLIALPLPQSVLRPANAATYHRTGQPPRATWRLRFLPRPVGVGSHRSRRSPTIIATENREELHGERGLRIGLQTGQEVRRLGKELRQRTPYRAA